MIYMYPRNLPVLLCDIVKVYRCINYYGIGNILIIWNRQRLFWRRTVRPLLDFEWLIYSLKATIVQKTTPDSNHSLGYRWHFVGCFVGPTLTNDVGPLSYCSSDWLNCQRLVRWWYNARSPKSPSCICQHYANHVAFGKRWSDMM